METLRLFRLAREGDEEALESLLGDVRPYIRMLAACYVRQSSRLDASDLAQDVLVQAAKAIADFRGETDSEFQAWLKVILRSKIADEARRLSAAKRGGAAGANVGDAAIQDVAGGHSSPSGAMARQENAVALAAALEQLPDEQREAVELKHLHGCSTEELLAHFPGRSAEAIHSLVYRGMTRLRNILDSQAR